MVARAHSGFPLVLRTTSNQTADGSLFRVLATNEHARAFGTDRFCAHAKAGEGEAQTDYFDESRKELALRVTKTGTRSWTYHFTLGGRRVRMTFGTYPASSLAKAHTLADEANAARARFISSNLASASSSNMSAGHP